MPLKKKYKPLFNVDGTLKADGPFGYTQELQKLGWPPPLAMTELPRRYRMTRLALGYLFGGIIGIVVMILNKNPIYSLISTVVGTVIICYIERND